MTAAELGQQVKALRKSAGFTQKKLAELSGVTERTIINIELGRHQTGSKELNAIAVACNYQWSFYPKTI